MTRHYFRSWSAQAALYPASDVVIRRPGLSVFFLGFLWLTAVYFTAGLLWPALGFNLVAGDGPIAGFFAVVLGALAQYGTCQVRVTATDLVVVNPVHVTSVPLCQVAEWRQGVHLIAVTNGARIRLWAIEARNLDLLTGDAEPHAHLVSFLNEARAVAAPVHASMVSRLRLTTPLIGMPVLLLVAVGSVLLLRGAIPA